MTLEQALAIYLTHQSDYDSGGGLGNSPRGVVLREAQETIRAQGKKFLEQAVFEETLVGGMGRSDQR